MSTAIPFLADGFVSLEGGMDSGRAATSLLPNQSAFMINATARSGFPENRPGIKKRTLIFPDEDTQERFETGMRQHSSWYRPDVGPSFRILVISGRIYKVNTGSDNSVEEISIPGDLNPSNRMCGWSVQAENFWVYQDGQSPPFIFDGAVSRRAAQGEIKVGTVMEYVQGRIWYASQSGMSFRATDLVYSDSGTAFYRYRDSVLKETENTFLNEGGDFAIPSGSGPIRAMRPFAILDTSQGQGPLQVFTSNTIFSVNTPVDRTIWKDLQYPIQTVSMIGSGAENQEGTIHVNSDIFYRSGNGVRSELLARRDFRTWGNVPQSAEMNRVIVLDQPDLLFYGSAVNFDNRLLMTASPAFSYSGVYHRGLIALDFNPVSSMSRQSPPAWDGIWTGVRFMALVNTDAGCFADVLGNDDKIEIWEITKHDEFDNETTPIQWVVETRGMSFKAGMDEKVLETAWLSRQKLIGTVNWAVQWRSDEYPCWFDWHEWSDCATKCSSAPDCPPGSPYQQQYRPKARLPQPRSECNDTVGLPNRHFFDVQLRISVTGPALIKGLVVLAKPFPERIYDKCVADGECQSLRCCLPDPFAYEADPVEA